MVHRVTVGGLNQESNAFAAEPARREDFVEIRSDKMIRVFEGTSTEIAGFIETVERAGSDVVPVGFAWAETGGLLPAAEAEALVDELVTQVVAAEPDVVLLALHGSMAAQGIDDVEGMLLGRLRLQLGSAVVIGATLDWHATLSAEMVENADLLVSYRTYPHIDQKPRAERLAELALAAADGAIAPTPGWCHPPLLIAGPQTAHEARPMAELLATIDSLVEQHPAVLDWSLCPGYARSDVQLAGLHAYVVTDGAPGLAVDLAGMIASLAWERREEFAPDVKTVAEAMEILRSTEGRLVLSDQGDNPGGGAPGTSTELLRAVLDEVASAPGAHDRSRPIVVCGLAAPDAVAAASDAGVGATITVTLGSGDHEVVSGAEVLHLGTGDYVMRSPTHDGLRRRIGQTATVAIGPVQVVLTSIRVQNEDLQMLEGCGIDIDASRALVVKSNAHFRAAFGPIAKQIVDVDTAGLSTPRLERLPFERIDRPAHPLDADVVWRVGPQPATGDGPDSPSVESSGQ